MFRRLLLALVLLSTARAEALILDSADPTPTTSPPADDPGWNHVGDVGGGLTGIYLGNGWVLTANHVATSNSEFQGVWYPYVPGSDVQLLNPDLTPADLKVFRIDPSPNLPLLRIRATTPPEAPVVTNVTMIGRGLWRGATTSWMGHGGYLWGTANGKRWGTNRVYETGFAGGSWTISTDFTKVTMGGTTHEAQGATGDSGGALFIKNGSNWELAGVLFAIGPYSGQPDSTALYGKVTQPIGNITYAIDLAVYRDQLIEATRPECANEVDDDGDNLVDWPADPGCTSQLDDTELPDQDLDGVGDPEDNCLTVANGDQLDTNLDGYGNLCDGDFDGDDAVGSPDFTLLKLAYLKGQGDPGYDADIDLDGDGVVGSVDFSLFRNMYLSPPGPSGLACAGTPPCP
ncbi:MAG TPA: trypsin-like serine protease [Myxococcota bacterium]|jgi:hypothetical protein